MPNIIERPPTEEIHGYYGKAPTHGDFIGKGLPRSFKDPWDTWLQNLIAITRKELTDDWLELYLTCPIYRFALSPGICGSQAWQGVIIPSVDQVGRYYPMTLCRSIPNINNVFHFFSDHEQWFEDAEVLILSCLSDNFSLDVFEKDISLLDASQNKQKKKEDEPTNFHKIIQCHTKNAWRTTTTKPIQPHIYSFLLDEILKKYCLSYSLWWTAGSDRVAPSVILSQGLPPLQGSCAMLDGNWSKWGWTNNTLINCFSL